MERQKKEVTGTKKFSFHQTQIRLHLHQISEYNLIPMGVFLVPRTVVISWSWVRKNGLSDRRRGAYETRVADFGAPAAILASA